MRFTPAIFLALFLFSVAVSYAAEIAADDARLQDITQTQLPPPAIHNLFRKAAQGDRQAFATLLSMAQHGVPDAQIEMADLYRDMTIPSLNIKSDPAEREKWLHEYAVSLQKQADQGNMDAQVNLGGLYLDGVGVKKDDAQASKLFLAAAEQGNLSGQMALGWGYQNGYSGIARDIVEAEKWFLKAAAQGERNAMQQLEKIYLYKYKKRTEGSDNKDYLNFCFWAMLSRDTHYSINSSETVRMIPIDPEGFDEAAKHFTNCVASPDAPLTQQQRDDIQKRVAEWEPICTMDRLVSCSAPAVAPSTTPQHP